MHQSDFLRLARYNAWANRRLYDACAQLSEADYKAPRASFFGSIHKTLNHILVGDRLWHSRMIGQPLPLALDEELHDNFTELRAAREQMDAQLTAFVEALHDDDLGVAFDYRDTQGNAHHDPLGPILQHLFNHQTHHRGQVHGLLSQTEITPPPLDLIYFLREEKDA